jgi:small subunit ribosomal protein S20
MPVLKSSKKRARQSEVRRQQNVVRKTAVKSAMKKVLTALEVGNDIEEIKKLLRDAEAKLSRAKSKGVFHAKTAARKASRLAKKVAAVQKTAAKQ